MESRSTPAWFMIARVAINLDRVIAVNLEASWKDKRESKPGGRKGGPVDEQGLRRGVEVILDVVNEQLAERLIPNIAHLSGTEFHNTSGGYISLRFMDGTEEAAEIRAQFPAQHRG